jgi:hypothetical protein
LGVCGPGAAEKRPSKFKIPLNHVLTKKITMAVH